MPVLKVIDLFAGAGGFGLGFQLAGYELRCSLEIDHWAAETLRRNEPEGSTVIEADIRDYQSDSEIRQACGGVVPDVLIGGPPCQGFSIAGPANKDPRDPRNNLFKEYARWVGCLEPRVFVLENVKGILWRRNASREKVIDIIRRTFTDLGYFVEVWQLNAAEYGVPQLRERVFIVGNRTGRAIGEPPATHRLVGNATNARVVSLGSNCLPRATSVWDAISDLPAIAAGEGEEEQQYSAAPESEYQAWARGAQTVLYNHVAMKHRDWMVERFRQISWNQSVSDVPTEFRARKRNGNGATSETVYQSNNRRIDPSGPSYTVPAQFYSSFIHPYQHRNVTAREAARLQSFPDCHRFMGKRTVVSSKLLKHYERHDENFLSQYNQIGNAVPPLLARAIALHIRQVLESSD